MSINLDEQRARAQQLGAKAAAAGMCDLDNPYVNTSEGLAELWASGYFGYCGAVRVVKAEERRLRGRA